MTKAEQFAARIARIRANAERAGARKIKQRTTRLLNLPAIPLPPSSPWLKANPPKPESK